MPSDDEIHRLRDEVSGDEAIEITFRRLRQDGHSRLEAVRLILDVLDVSLVEAKRLLVRNDTWQEAQSAAGQGMASGDKGANDDQVPPAPA